MATAAKIGVEVQKSTTRNLHSNRKKAAIN